jgi:hypothetical protein
MKFFLKYVAPIFAIVWLAEIHPLGAVVAIILCGVRSAFKGHLFGRLFAHALYDLLKAVTLGLTRLFFRRGRN